MELEEMWAWDGFGAGGDVGMGKGSVLPAGL